MAYMEDDLYIPAKRATRLVENIQAFMAADPTDDAGWDEVLLRQEAILGALIEVLKDNDLPAPDFEPVYANNPYAE